jgi:hypothetical protein
VPSRSLVPIAVSNQRLSALAPHAAAAAACTRSTFPLCSETRAVLEIPCNSTACASAQGEQFFCTPRGMKGGETATGRAEMRRERACRGSPDCCCFRWCPCGRSRRQLWDNRCDHHRRLARDPRLGEVRGVNAGRDDQGAARLERPGLHGDGPHTLEDSTGSPPVAPLQAPA